MRPDDLVERHVVLIEQTIRGLAIGPRLGLIGRAAVGPRRRLLRQPDQPFRPSLITQFTFPKRHPRPLLRFQNHHRDHPPCARHATAGSPASFLATIPASTFPEAPQRTSPLAASRFQPTQANPSPMPNLANPSGNTQLARRRNRVESTNLWVIQRLRVPCIVRWPGQIPAGFSSFSTNPISTMGSLPHVARLAGASLPQDPNHRRARCVAAVEWPAGRDISPHAAFYYYYMDQLQAVRVGPLETAPASGSQTNESRRAAPPRLRRNCMIWTPTSVRRTMWWRAMPTWCQRLTALADAAREDLGDGPTAGQAPAPCRPGCQSRAASLLRLTTCGSAVGLSQTLARSNGRHRLTRSQRQRRRVSPSPLAPG